MPQVAPFIYQPSGGAEGDFNVAVKTGDDAFILTDSSGSLRSNAPEGMQLIGVGIDCFYNSYCDDGNECTTDTCADSACTYQNVVAGTTCDDGLFCTSTDECDGNGACVGNGTPCDHQRLRPPRPDDMPLKLHVQLR